MITIDDVREIARGLPGAYEQPSYGGRPSAVAEAASSTDPTIGLAAVRTLRTLLESLEELQVTNARRRGWSWQQIADGLGVSRQAVHKKYRYLG